MAKREMDLRMRILAEGRQAMGELRRVGAGVQTLAGKSASAARGARTMFRHVGSGVGILLKPLDIAAKGALGLGAALAAVSYKALGASADIESLKLRLESVTATKEEADKAFNTAMKLSVASPFTPEQMVETSIGLRNLGLTGEDALTAIGDAAALTERDLGYLNQVLGSLSTESLRALGIEMTKAGDQYEFGFRDRMQRWNKIVASGVDEARQSLLKIFDIKYGGGMAKLAGTLKGLKSTLVGNIRKALGAYGDGLKPLAKQFMMSMDAELVRWIKSGKLQEIGAKLAEKLEDAFDIGKQLVADPEQLRKVLGASMAFAARAFLEYLSTGKDVLISLAQMMAAAFVGAIIDSGLPGTGAVREHMIKRMAPRPEAPPLFGTNEQYAQHQADVDAMYARRRELREDPALFQSELTRRHSVQFAESAAAVPARFAQAGRNLDGIWQDTMAPVLPRSRLFHGSGDPWVDRFDRGMHQDSLAGINGGGQAAPIVIHNLTVRGNEVREIQNKIMRQAAVPRLSAAGGY